MKNVYGISGDVVHKYLYNDNYDDIDEDDNSYDNDVMMTWKVISETTAMRENNDEGDDENSLITYCNDEADDDNY